MYEAKKGETTDAAHHKSCPVQQYMETIFASELQKYGLTEWLQIQNIIASHQGIHAQELKVALNQLIEKC